MQSYKPRLEPPELGNKYYILDDDGGYSTCIRGNRTTGCYTKKLSALPNCVGFAAGRINEIGEFNKFKYVISGHAEDWFANAKTLGFKTGKIPKLGAIAVWRKGNVKNSKDGCGHVAVVEHIISSDYIVTGESGWSAKKRHWLTVRYIGSDGNWGMNGYTFLGFIYHPDVKETTTQAIKLSVDGIWGTNTTYKLQVYLGTKVDGTISGQRSKAKKCFTSSTNYTTKTWKFTNTLKGSDCIRALQKLIGTNADGFIGTDTVKGLQKFLNKKGFYVDNITGILDKETIKSLQKFLNEMVK